MIQLTDDERDQLVEVLQKLRSDKDARKAKLKKRAGKEISDATEEAEAEEDKFDGAKVLQMAQERAGEMPPQHGADAVERSSKSKR